MNEKSSLLAYIKTGNFDKEPNIRKTGKDLEATVSNYHPRLKEIFDGRNEKIFDIYLDAKDIDEGMMKTYLNEMGRLSKVPYKEHKNSWLRKLRKSGHEYFRYQDGVSEPFTVIGLLGGGVTAFFTTIAMLVGDIDPAIGLPIISGANIPNALMAYFWWIPTKLKPEYNKFKKDKARDYILELRKFHHLCQQMEKEVEDINSLDEKSRKEFVMKYGLNRMDREKIKLDSVTKDYREARILEYGKLEVEERITKAKEIMTFVKNEVEGVLKNAGADLLVLDSNYITHGERVYERNNGDIEKVERELNNVDLEDKLKELRKVTEAKLKQGA